MNINMHDKENEGIEMPVQPALSDTSTSEGSADKEPIVEPENALPSVKLEDLPERMRQAATRAGWTELMPVQA
ncbi:MAG: hypothetical protein PHT33_15470, partial [bacterium]|nr:hypothetical protein [bacterium]